MSWVLAKQQGTQKGFGWAGFSQKRKERQEIFIDKTIANLNIEKIWFFKELPAGVAEL